MKHVTLVAHPLLANALTYLRDKTTTTEDFRTHTAVAVQSLLLEASRGLHTETVSVETPLERVIVPKMHETVLLLPILRAGLSMLPAAQTLFPNAPIGLAGLRRDEATAKAQEYYWNVPDVARESLVLVLDPMLATGGSVLHVLKKLSDKEYQRIRVITVIAAPEGIEAVHNDFSGVDIFTGSIDTRLNAQKYIVPGLGDFGDRYFGT